MKIPLQYQRTEYDCGPTTLLNAISFLFQRKDVPPELLQHITLYCLDSYNGKGERGKNGTSYIAMQFLAGWLNHFSKAKKFAVETEYLTGPEVSAGPNSKIIGALQQGGVVVARVMYGCWHYVLLTGCAGKTLTLWDPYYRVKPFATEGGEIEILTGFPCEKKRRIQTEMLNREAKTPYAFGPVEGREAVILFNKDTRKTPEKTIEYFI